MLVKRAVIGSHIAAGANTETNAATPRIDDEYGTGDEVPSNSNRTLSPASGRTLADSMVILLSQVLVCEDARSGWSCGGNVTRSSVHPVS